MERHGPFVGCRWCGERFRAQRSSDDCCSLGCAEEMFQTREELRIVQGEFNSLNDHVESLHERIYRLHRRVERQVSKLKKLGDQWSATTNQETLFSTERQERRVSLVLGRLNSTLERYDREALPKERKLFDLEKAVAKLKQLVGEC